MRGRKRSRSATGTRATSGAGASVPARTSARRQGLHPFNKHDKWESLVDATEQAEANLSSDDQASPPEAPKRKTRTGKTRSKATSPPSRGDHNRQPDTPHLKFCHLTMSQMVQDWTGQQTQTLKLSTVLNLRQRGAGCTGAQVHRFRLPAPMSIAMMILITTQTQIVKGNLLLLLVAPSLL